MKTTVKTQERAIEILNNWLNENLTEELLSTSTVIEQTTIMCVCGQTTAMRAFYEGGNKFAVVGYCDNCGNDDAFINDVITIR